MPLKRLQESLVEVVNSPESNTVKARIVKKIGTAIVNSLEGMRAEGVNRETIARAAREQIAVLRELESEQFSSTLRFSILVSLSRLERLLRWLGGSIESTASVRKELVKTVSELAGKKGRQEDLRLALDRLVSVAFKEAVIAFLDGQPSRAFTTPLDETRLFLERLSNSNPEGISKPVRELLERRKWFLERISNPESLRSKIEMRRERRLNISSQIEEAKTIKELNTLEQRIHGLRFDRALDRKTSNLLLSEIRKRKQEISKELVGKTNRPQKPKLERYKGHVWLGRWIPLYRLERYLRNIPPRRQLRALADFQSAKRGSPLGNAAIEALREAQEIHVREHGKPTDVITLLREMEQRGKRIE